MSELDLFKMRKAIKLTLMKIGIRCDLVGFAYLCSAVELVILNPDLINHLCTQLYVNVGEKYNVQKCNSVERSIRHAIENTMNAKSFSEINKMFNAVLFSIDEKPTVGQLIKLVADYYTLGLYEQQMAI